MRYTIEVINDEGNLTYQSNDILEILSRLRDLWNQDDFYRLKMRDSANFVYFLCDRDGIFITPEIKLMLNNFPEANS